MSAKGIAKNLLGWHTRRRILVFAVDDYGNVRLDSREALERLEQACGGRAGRFDQYDTLETRQDLEALYHVLDGVRDGQGRAAVFTPYALSLNLDFEAMAEVNYERLILEPLTRTWKKLASRYPEAYAGVAELWREGIERGWMRPEFHGGVHFHVPTVERMLAERDPRLLAALRERSLTLMGGESRAHAGWTAAFSLSDPATDTRGFRETLAAGVRHFESAFGRPAVAFTPPAHEFSSLLEPALDGLGLRGIDLPLLQHEHPGQGRPRRRLNWTGRRRREGRLTMVRNVMFEPGATASAVDHALQQIAVAFRCRKPAIVSSHRVNFCGHIDPANRNHGLRALDQLLREVVRRWPDVEFFSVDQLVTEITETE